MSKTSIILISFSQEFLKQVASSIYGALDSLPSSDEERECLMGYPKEDQMEYGLNCPDDSSFYSRAKKHSEWQEFRKLHMASQIELVKPHFSDWEG